MSDNRKKAGLAIGALGALAIAGQWIFNLTGFATDVATLADNERVAAFCDAASLGRYCGSRAIAPLTGPNGAAATAATTPPPPSPAISVAIAAGGASDGPWAAKLNSDLGAALAPASSGGSGYRIEGRVSDSAITPSHHARLSFGWSIAKGSVVMDCGASPLVFPGRMPGKLVNDVARLISPALSSSIRYGDVRCS